MSYKPLAHYRIFPTKLRNSHHTIPVNKHIHDILSIFQADIPLMYRRRIVERGTALIIVFNVLGLNMRIKNIKDIYK